LTLRSFAKACLWASFLSLVLLAFLGYQGLHNVRQGQQQLQILKKLEQQTHDMNLAVDYVTVLRPDPGILESLRDNLANARRDFENLQQAHPDRALLHLDEVDYLLGYLHKLVVRHNPATDAIGFHNRTVPLAQQIRIHSAGAASAIRDMLMAVRRQTDRNIERMTLWLGALVLVFAMFALVMAALIWQRVLHPLRLLDSGIQKMAEGRTGVRVDLQGHHELANLVQAFNEMAAARESHEKRLAESEQKFRQITESIGEVFWMRSPDLKRWLHVSAAFEKIWGLPVAELLATPGLWFEHIHPEDRHVVRRAMDACRQGEYSLEYRIIRPDGALRWVADSAFPVLDANGAVIQVVGVARDVTERHLIESRLEERIKEINCLYRVLDLTTASEDRSMSICAEICDVMTQSVLEPALAVARITVGDTSVYSKTWQTPIASIARKIVLDSRLEGEVEIGYTAIPQARKDEGKPFLAEEETMLEAEPASG